VSLGRVSGIVESVVSSAAAEGWPCEVLRPEQTVERRPPQTVGTAHPAFDRLLTWTHPPVFRALIAGARIAGLDPLVLTGDRRALVESTFDREQLDRNPVMARRLGPTRRRRGRHLALVGPWSHNHFHWFLDLLPRLALLPLDDEPQTPVVVPATISALQRESLERCGIAPGRLVAAPAPRFGLTPELSTDELWFPSLTGRTTGNPPSWVVDWLRERLAPIGRAGRATRLYVSRADAALRRVVNEPEVEAELRRRGFETILPGTLSLAEQLERFAGAEAVVGAHGAGLVGTFAAHDATIVELFEPSYVNGCFYALADAAGHDYWYLLGADAGEGDIAVDLTSLRRTLDAARLTVVH
jgi:hypothetical protein